MTAPPTENYKHLCDELKEFARIMAVRRHKVTFRGNTSVIAQDLRSSPQEILPDYLWISVQRWRALLSTDHAAHWAEADEIAPPAVGNHGIPIAPLRLGAVTLAAQLLDRDLIRVCVEAILMCTFNGWILLQSLSRVALEEGHLWAWRWSSRFPW